MKSETIDKVVIRTSDLNKKKPYMASLWLGLLFSIAVAQVLIVAGPLWFMVPRCLQEGATAFEFLTIAGLSLTPTITLGFCAIIDILTQHNKNK